MRPRISSPSSFKSILTKHVCFCHLAGLRRERYSCRASISSMTCIFRIHAIINSPSFSSHMHETSNSRNHLKTFHPNPLTSLPSPQFPLSAEPPFFAVSRFAVLAMARLAVVAVLLVTSLTFVAPKVNSTPRVVRHQVPSSAPSSESSGSSGSSGSMMAVVLGVIFGNLTSWMKNDEHIYDWLVVSNIFYLP